MSSLSIQKVQKSVPESVVVPVWSRSLQVAVHVFGKYSGRVPHMTVKAHGASHKFHDIFARWLLAILPVNVNKKKTWNKIFRLLRSNFA